ncbi:hypothetical protein CDL15_Pgr027491 [Punica granatum]|uniref:Plastocyanin-like domain-containing protein n=1 Tax=Punica granatum TaxID=22663 RepID=A0A218XIG1_PUNGR|nr:hypothetical protein CDL15_Pgr027491 [Punica granatum]
MPNYVSRSNFDVLRFIHIFRTFLPKRRTSARIDVILQNANALSVNESEIHSWHQHGRDFWVLGYGEGKFTGKNAKGFNLKNPQLRNTTVVFLYGWTALRFVADNPGVWSFHCRIELNLHMGMAVVFAEGVELLSKVPVKALTCRLTAKMVLNGT